MITRWPGLMAFFVDFKRVGAVFQGIRDAGGFGGELLRFSNGNETSVEAVGQGGSKNEPRASIPATTSWCDRHSGSQSRSISM